MVIGLQHGAVPVRLIGVQRGQSQLALIHILSLFRLACVRASYCKYVLWQCPQTQSEFELHFPENVQGCTCFLKGPSAWWLRLFASIGVGTSSDCDMTSVSPPRSINGNKAQPVSSDAIR